MSVICDGCGTDQRVRRSFITFWNGNVMDLCRQCMKPFVDLVDGKDGIWFRDPNSSNQK